MRYQFKTKQILPLSKEEAWGFFSSPKNLALITPSRMNFEILSISRDEEMYTGQIIKYKITVLPWVRMHWETEIIDVQKLQSFTDIQRKGPYSYWAHKHSFQQVNNGIEMTDELEYAVPYGWIGRLANYAYVQREVKSIFEYRFQVLEKLFKKKS